MNTTPIEFMAWNTNKNKRYTHYEIDDMDKEGFVFWSDVIRSSNGWVPLQRTALCSINDEPIYNHMIVMCMRWGKYYLVDMFDYKKMERLSRIQLEIVGNRFQNPELLELCK